MTPTQEQSITNILKDAAYIAQTESPQMAAWCVLGVAVSQALPELNRQIKFLLTKPTINYAEKADLSDKLSALSTGEMFRTTLNSLSSDLSTIAAAKDQASAKTAHHSTN